MARKATAKKKTASRKTSSRSAAVKRAPARKKKTAAKKTTAKKKATKKKTATKKAAAKKKTTSRKAAPAKKTTARAAKPAPKPVVKAKKATKPKNTSTLSYTQSEFLENLRAFCGLEKKSQAKELWEDMSTFVTDALKRGYRIPLVNLGKMYVRKSKARMGRNPATGEIIHIAAKKRVRFTASKALKDSVL
ncbi:HU family DNA-binding protein [bacterium]|nr:HU family DNA-binding protein [bacterium]